MIKEKGLWVEGISQRSKNAPTHNDIWIIDEVFKGRRELHGKGGFYIECGAHNGSFGCTYLLEKKYGWTGILIEPTKKHYDECVVNRPYSVCVNAALNSSEEEVLYSEYGEYQGSSGIQKNFGKNREFPKVSEKVEKENTSYMIKPKTLEKVLDENHAPKIVDYLALDVERSEYEILRVFPFGKYKFKAVSIEMGGCTFLKLVSLMKSNGYVRVDNPFTKSINEVYFIHKDHIEIKYK